MASIKDFKAEIKSLCENVHNECYVELLFGSSNEIEMVWSIMVKCEKLKADTLASLSDKSPKKMPPKERGLYYKNLYNGFYSKTMELIEDLNKIIP